MPTLPVRKFAISVDPDELVDFEEDLNYFEEVFSSLGFEQHNSYRFRYNDRECTLTAQLNSSTDGYELWMVVQAADEHQFRIEEVADAFDAYVMSGGQTGTHRHNSTSMLS